MKRRLRICVCRKFKMYLLWKSAIYISITAFWWGCLFLFDSFVFYCPANSWISVWIVERGCSLRWALGTLVIDLYHDGLCLDLYPSHWCLWHGLKNPRVLLRVLIWVCPIFFEILYRPWHILNLKDVTRILPVKYGRDVYWQNFIRWFGTRGYSWVCYCMMNTPSKSVYDS